MKLYQWSFLLGLLSYVIGGVFRRSGSFPGNVFAILLLLILPAVAGAILGVISWKRKESSRWWALAAVLLNLAMILTGLLLLWPG